MESGIPNTSLFCRSAADAVGEVTSCDEEQLASFMVLAKNAYGSDVTKWDFTTVGNIGTVIGMF